MEIVIKSKTPAYPYLGVSPNGDVVLFEAPRTGTRLRANRVTSHFLTSWHPDIYYTNTWAEENFKPFEGEIKVSN